ncbi:MAG: DUF4174 domain-containing protein [Pseudomonadota bacterium]
MLRKTLVIMAACIAAMHSAAAQDTQSDDPLIVIPAEEANLDEYLWTARPVVVFADTPADPRFQQQLDFLGARSPALVERDVVVITDADPGANSALRQKLRPRGFMIVLIGKDGGVKFRKPAPYDVREISRTIDKMPMRQDEIRHRRAVTQ